MLSSLKLNVRISFDLQVDDFISAGEHQRRIEDLLQDFRKAYPGVECEFTPRRARKSLGLRIAAPAPRRTETYSTT